MGTMCNLQSRVETTHQFHNNYNSVNHLLSSNDSKLLITSNRSSEYSKLWSVGDNFDEKNEFKQAYHLEFSHLVQDKVVGTQSFGIATVYDLHTGQLCRTLKPSNRYYGHDNRATFDPSDSLILSDGVLWDYRAPKQIHRFDELNRSRHADVFHPNGLEFISNTEVWDIRTFRLVQIVPQIDQCQVVFNSGGEVIFANYENKSEDDDKDRYWTAFKTFDSSDYSLLATIDTKDRVSGLCSSWDDCFLAVNEFCNESTVKIYDIGKLRTNEVGQEDGASEVDDEVDMTIDQGND